MMNLSIELLSMAHTDPLFQFETENRAYFSRIGLGRGDAYYYLQSFSQILAELTAEQEEGGHYMYVVLDSQGTVVGRVNFTDVVRGPLQKAELGYRIGESHQGKGYGTAAVALALEQARTVHGLHRIEAGTAPENTPSQHVLLKNGFRQVGVYRQYIRKGDQWADSAFFEKVLD